MEDYNAINSFPRPNLPDGFRTLLFALSKEVLREQPVNIHEFCADFFGRRLLNRGDSWVTFKERYDVRRKERAKEEAAKLKAMPQAVTESTANLSLPEEFTAEQQEAAVKIQAGVRGMLARRNMTHHENNYQQEHDRWLHPQEQLQRDLQTISESISFAQLESNDGVWEACQRWLHPDQQLQRDLQTVAEPVECAYLRERDPSLENVPPPAPAMEQTADRAGSPPEVVSPAHSTVSVASAGATPAPAPLDRAPSIASVQSARASAVSLAESVHQSPHTDSIDRAASLEAMSNERGRPPSRPTTPPSPPVHILDGKTVGSHVDLASELSHAAAATADDGERPVSPPELATPRHSAPELAEESQWPELATARAGSPPEVLSPQHSDVDVASTVAPLPDTERADSPSGEGVPQPADQ